MRFAFGISFSDLNSSEGLLKLDRQFDEFIKANFIDLHHQLHHYRNSPAVYSKAEYSEFIINLAPILEDFLTNLFGVEKENLHLKQQCKDFDIIYECRRKFVQRVALNRYPITKLTELNFAEIAQNLKSIIGQITERSLASAVINWQLDSDKYAAELDLAARYSAYMVHNHSQLSLFDIPRPVDPSDLIRQDKINKLKEHSYLGFDCQDKGLTLSEALAHSKYCIYCHNQQKDTCSKGGVYQNQDKKGCPLKQKISEMNFVAAKGLYIAALAVITIDNPLVVATGHRICNDCMKACIYQKQDPVNIPLVESNILQKVIELPYGVEIYLLLTRWNPLNISYSLPKQMTGRNVLVTGLGPAGFALSHYLLNEGHNVVAIDGMKIMPLEFNPAEPVKYWPAVKKRLSARIPQGFGGVAEYGITNRWDKNNLTLIRLSLERRANFAMYGGVRLGSNITPQQAFTLGFDHIALCTGAGKPKFINSSGYFLGGVRFSADFLMLLQQGGAYLKDTNTNLIVRLPAIVIGGGLTAVDSAVQLMHYYPKQVIEFAEKYNKYLLKKHNLTDEEIEIAEEFISHAELFRQAKDDKEKIAIIRKLGGVTICYRGKIKDSPAYRLNHEEIEHAIAIGVDFMEEMTPTQLIGDKNNQVREVKFTNNQTMSAKTVLVSIGTEHNDFQDIKECFDETGSNIFKTQDNKISYFGDCNPNYSGSVVEALASAKNGFTAISDTLKASPATFKGNFPEFKLQLEDLLVARIMKVNKLSDNIVELIVKSPLAARNFRPGQFFRLQNFAANPEGIMEPLALTGSEINLKEGTISLIILESGKSTRLCKDLKAGEEVVLMGPTGTPTEISHNKNIVLIGGGLGNAVLLPIGMALKNAGCHIIYFAGYKRLHDRFYPDKIEKLANIVVWSCEEQVLLPDRKQDLSIKGNIIDGLNAASDLGLLEGAERVICIGSNKMMEAVSNRQNNFFNSSAELICSVNSPMQCMMKGICGQCIQKTNNDKGYIFTCACQDQRASEVDFKVLSTRLAQNSLFEKL